jgi:hypothetical protein
VTDPETQFAAAKAQIVRVITDTLNGEAERVELDHRRSLRSHKKRSGVFPLNPG